MAGYTPTQIRKPSNETEFEKHCVVLFRDVINDVNVKRLGTRGQKQDGVDIIGNRDGDSARPIGIQCKLKSKSKKLTDREVKKEVGAALLYQPALTEYFIVTTANDDTRLDQLSQQLTQDQEKAGRKIRIVIWGWDTLEERINQYPAAKNAFDPGFSPAIASHERKLDVIIGKLDALQGQSGALTAAAQSVSLDAATRYPPQLADREMTEGLALVLRRRGFVGPDIAAELAALAGRAIGGELILGSPALRAEVCDRAARGNATPEGKDKARHYRDAASAADPNRDLSIANALLLEAEGDSDGALRAMRRHTDPDSRAAMFMMLLRKRDAEAALQWSQSEHLTVADYTAAGAMNLIMTEVQRGEFEAARSSTAALPQGYLDQCPALYLIRAQITLGSVLPEDQKGAIFQGLPVNPRVLQLASGATTQQRLAEAHGDLQHLLGQLQELQLGHLARYVSELELWVRLEGTATREAARSQLAEEIAAPDKTLHRVRLALAYDVPFNREALERHLAERKELGGWTPDERHAALLLAVQSGNSERIAAFFDAHHDDLFAQTELAVSNLAMFEIQAMARVGRFGDARRHLAMHRQQHHVTADQGDEIEEMVGHIEADDEVEAHRQHYTQSKSLTDLRLLVAGLRARLDINQLADYAPALARATKTSADFEIAVGSLFQTHRYIELLSLMEELPELRDLNDEWVGVQGWALYRLGRVMEARAIARTLVGRRAVATDRELAINTAIETGDWGYIQTILASEAARAETIPANELMRLARLALETNSFYLDQFRDAALAKAPDDPQINLAAYMLASNRGTEYQGPDPHAWFQKAVAGSGAEGPVRQVSMREILDTAPGWNQRADTVDQSLRRAEMPLFIAAKAVRRQVMDLTLGQALRNTDPDDRRVRFPIFAFSGAQGFGPIPSDKAVAFDITSLITLDYLGLLDKVLTHFARVIIAPKTLGMLFAERQFLKFHQPSRIAYARRIQSLIGAGRLKVVSPNIATPPRGKEIGPDLAAFLELARRDGNLVVRSSPVFKLASFLEEKADLTEYADVLTDTSAVLAFLANSGKIDAETREQAANYLKQHDEGWSNPQPVSATSNLYIDDLTVGTLDHVGLLDPLTRAVASVSVHVDLAKETHNFLQHEEHAAELLDAVERIRAALHTRLETGRVVFSTRRTFEKSDDEEKDEFFQSATLDLMGDLSEIDAMCADDRFLNKLAHWTDAKGNMAVSTSTLSVLASLHAAKQIDDPAYWRARHKLRAAGYYAVALEATELELYLRAAPCDADGLRETPELKAIRENLRLPQINAVFVAAEIPWLNGVRHAVCVAIRDVWKTARDFDQAATKANWLLSILPNPLEWCVEPENEGVWAAARQQLAVQVGLLLAFVGASMECRQRYFTWLQEGVIEPLQDKSPEIWDATMEFFKRYTVRLTEVEDEKE